MVSPYYNWTDQTMYNTDTIGGVDVYILTAYFVDPQTICSSTDIPNRRLGDTGTGLWLQNGTDPIQNSFTIPLDQNKINETKWTLGHCFYSMGKQQNCQSNIVCLHLLSRCSLLVR